MGGKSLNKYEIFKYTKALNKKIEYQENYILQLKSIINVSSLIISSLAKKDVLGSILEQTKKIMECLDSSILLIDFETNKLYFEALSNDKDIEALSDIRLNIGEGIAGHVWKTGKSLIIKDVSNDRRFCNKVDNKLKNITRSIIAVPLIVNNRIIGVMEAINKKSNNTFNKYDLEIFQLLSTYAAIAIENAILYEMAITDGLTRLYVKSYFITRLIEEMNRSKRQNYNLALIMFDIDHFKIFNDTYGHQAGDIVLKNTSKAIIKNARKSDIPARYGGEEFIVLLTDTNKEGGMLFAERVREIVKSVKIKKHKKNISVTISAGVASLKENEPKDHIEFIEMADQALYYSKRNGRDQVNFFKKE
ncbi:MAG: sensor domain-containing diguanylate cyclase [Spirochaetes bacterium]|nr:sensor domain-containing diguanylate cyclase [Spirochaetota bacterium]